MAMWAGVQKVSRPIEVCQEISQCAPTIADVTASVEHQTYQGIDAIPACSRRTANESEMGRDAIFPPTKGRLYLTIKERQRPVPLKQSAEQLLSLDCHHPAGQRV